MPNVILDHNTHRREQEQEQQRIKAKKAAAASGSSSVVRGGGGVIYSTFITNRSPTLITAVVTYRYPAVTPGAAGKEESVNLTISPNGGRLLADEKSTPMLGRNNREANGGRPSKARAEIVGIAVKSGGSIQYERRGPWPSEQPSQKGSLIIGDDYSFKFE